MRAIVLGASVMDAVPTAMHVPHCVDLRRGVSASPSRPATVGT